MSLGSKPRASCSNDACDEVLPSPLTSWFEDAPRLWQRHYRKLDESTKEIRLIRIRPGPLEAPIECNLIYTPLFVSPTSTEIPPGTQRTRSASQKIAKEFFWYALSYCWGPPTTFVQIGRATRQNPPQRISFDIQLNGDSVQVREGLYKCLIGLRYQGLLDPLWVDALCINQEDYQERGSQVQMMQEIYLSAGKVLIHLELRSRDQNNPVDESKETLHLKDVLKNKEAFGKAIVEWSLNSKSVPSLDYMAFLSDADQPYWYRLWTLQECASARSIDLIYGSSRMSWERFIEIQRIADDTYLDALTERDLHGISWESDGQKESHLKKMDRLICMGALNRDKLRGNAPIEDFLAVLWRHCFHSDCSDDRDYIYGLIGLLGSSYRTIRPDYTLCKWCVWREATITIIQQTGRLDVLSASGLKRDKDDIDQYHLSWVPRWAKLSVLEPKPDYRFSPKVSAKWRFSPDRRQLIAQGIVLGVVIGPHYDVYVEDASPWKINSQIISDLDRFLEANVSDSKYRKMCHDDLVLLFMESVEQSNLNALEAVQKVCHSTTNLLQESCEPYETGEIAHIYANLRTLMHLQRPMLIQLFGYPSDRPRLGIGDSFRMRKGDVICGLLGSNVPLVVRRHSKGDYIIGNCLVPGYGNGESHEVLLSGKLLVEEFNFI